MEDVVVEYSQLIQQRFSVRAYSSQPVEPEKLQRVLGSCPHCSHRSQSPALWTDCG
jgi:hypothetical protein